MYFSCLVGEEEESGVGSPSSPPFPPHPASTPPGRELGIDLPHLQPLSSFQALTELHRCHEQVRL